MSEPTINEAINLCWSVLNDGEVKHCSMVIHEALLAAYEAGRKDALEEGTKCFVLYWAGGQEGLCSSDGLYVVGRGEEDVGEELADKWDAEDERYQVRPARLIVGER